jgi:hypothetical protein
MKLPYPIHFNYSSILAHHNTETLIMIFENPAKTSDLLLKKAAAFYREDETLCVAGPHSIF